MLPNKEVVKLIKKIVLYKTMNDLKAHETTWNYLKPAETTWNHSETT